MPNYSGGNTLRDLIGLVKDKFNYLKGLIDKKQQPFPVTCTADFMNGTVTDMSSTFSEIKDAYKRGDHVFLDCDISQAVPGVRTQATLSVVAMSGSDIAMMSFEGTATMDGTTLFVTVLVADGMTSFTYDNLLTESVATDYIDNKFYNFTDMGRISQFVLAYLYKNDDMVMQYNGFPHYDIEGKYLRMYNSSAGEIFSYSINQSHLYLVMDYDGTAKLFYGNRQIKT